MNLYFIRHTKVDVSEGICYGFSDVDLADSFEVESNAIKVHTNTINFDKVFCSPLQRCKRLAEKLFQQEITYDERLKEMNFGDWEMQKWDEINRQEFDLWASNFVTANCPNGESFTEVYKRIVLFINDLKDTKSNTIAIISHSGAIRAAYAYLENRELKNVFSELKMDFGGIYKTQF